MNFKLSGRSKATNSIIWSGVENGGLAVLSFLTLVLLSRFLTPAQFGLFSVVLSLTELLGLFVSMFFHDALVQRQTVTEKHFNTAFTVTMFISVALFILCCLFATTFSRVMGDASAARILIWTALTFPLNGLTATIVPRYRRNLEFRNLAFRSLLGRICGSLVAIVMLFFHAGVWALVGQQLCMAGIASLLLWFKTDARPKLEFDRQCFQDLIGYGSFSLASLFVSFATRRVFIIVSGAFLGATASGYFNLSFRVVDMLWAIVATAVTQVALPILSRLQDDKVRLTNAYFRANQLQGFILFPCFVTIAILSREIVEFAFGTKWLPAAPYVTALGFLTIVQLPKLLAVPMLKASGHPDKVLMGNVTELILISIPLVILNSMTLPVAMTIWILRETIGCLIMMALLQYATGFSLLRQIHGLGIPAAVAGMMGVAMWVSKGSLPADLSTPMRIATMLSFCAVAYVTAMFIVLWKNPLDGNPLIQKWRNKLFGRQAQ